MSRSPRLTGTEVIAALSLDGFTIVRIRGSHRVLRHPDGRHTVVPVHSGETVGPGLLSKILRDCQMSGEEFLRLVQRQ